MTTSPVRPPVPDPGPPPPPPVAPRRSVRPLLLRLHFYAAVLAAPFLLVAALSGGLYALSPQVEQVIYADQLRTDSRGAPLPLDQQVEAARTVQPTMPLLAVRPGDGAGTTTRVLLDDGRTDQFRRLAVFVDPVDGEVLGQETAYGGSGALPVRTWVGELHRHLHLGEPGRIYSELAASWLGVVVVAGLGLWLTGRRSGYRSGSRLRPQRAGSPRRRALGLHGALGTWAALGFVMLSVTGLTWSTHAGANVSELRSALSWTAPAVVSEVAGGSSEQSGRAGDGGGHEGHSGHGGDPGPTFIPVDSLGVGYQSALTSARAEGLDGPVEVTGPTALDGTYVVSQTDSTWPTRGDVTSVDPSTGQVVDTVRFDQIPVMAKMASWGIDLHMGVLFGWFSALAMVGLAVGLVLMVVTGYRAWWLRRPTRGHRLRMGRAARRGAWRSLPPVATGLLVAGTVAVGWFLPVLGASLLLFLLLDLAVGLWGGRARSGNRVARSTASTR